MNTKLSRFIARSTAILVLLGSGTFGAGNVMAGDRYKRNYERHDGRTYDHRRLDREINRNERERRAFVAGAVAHNRAEYDRDNYRRDGYRDRYHDRYDDRYDDDDNSDKIGAALIGAAVGAIATGVIMSNKNSDNTSNDQ